MIRELTTKNKEPNFMLPPNADMLSVGTNREALESSTIGTTTKANTSEAIPFKNS